MDSPRSPKLFYGYFILIACFVILFHLWGMVLNTLPIFLKPITEDKGWSRGDFSIAALAGGVASLILHSSIVISLPSAALCVFLARSSRDHGRGEVRRPLVDYGPTQVP